MPVRRERYAKNRPRLCARASGRTGRWPRAGDAVVFRDGSKVEEARTQKTDLSRTSTNKDANAEAAHAAAAGIHPEPGGLILPGANLPGANLGGANVGACISS